MQLSLEKQTWMNLEWGFLMVLLYLHLSSTSTLSYYGPVINPWSPHTNKDGKQELDARIAGGSSGGSAVAVSARMCLA